VYGRTAARWFDAVGVTTHVYERRLQERGVAQNRIEYLGMGVDAELFTPGAARPRSGGLLFVGRLDDNHTYKRLDLAIEALATLRKRGVEAHLEVVGDGNRRAIFEAMTAQLGLASAVTFSGEVGGEELRDAYRRADALVLPSPSAAEGFGMVVLEAFACGCPVVTSVQAGAAEAVTASGEGGLWDGVRVDHLADTIAGVLQASASRDEVARTVRAYAETVHSWNAVGDRLGALLERALEHARR
jgi:glycosyltransferase involved in cell wall biosynthesis